MSKRIKLWSAINDLAKEIFLIIFDYVCDEKCEGIMLKLTCQKWNNLINNYSIHVNQFLFTSTRMGYINRCIYAKDHHATDFDKMLVISVNKNDYDLCLLAKEWGATNFNWMLVHGVREENERMCKLAIEFGATNFDEMFLIASRKSNQVLMDISKKHGADKFISLIS